ncbi:DUF262 domain-containing protein [Bacillus safensis]|uniref:DUF262 domain-containing protein n=1 Tax=Bacillus safensis TaxID=561879 RepID=UPI002E1B5209|nr:DUF262 domain-containing protein [Bacillus safensis]
MEIQNNSWNIRQYHRSIQNNKILFDYPIQRADGQWNSLQRSLLIHSIAQGYPIPPVFFLGEDGVIYTEKNGEHKEEIVKLRKVIDGKQRLTNISNFLSNGYSLDKATPEVFIEGEKFLLAGKSFDELDQEVQDAITGRTLSCYTIDSNTTTDEEIEDLFFRMNNGAPLSTQQKTKALIGTKWAEIMNELGEHPLVHNLSAFSKSQIATDAHLTALMQTMMMLDGGFDYKNVSQAQISEYGKTFKDDTEHKMELVEQVKKAMDYLLEVLDKKERLMLRKVHFPMTLITAKTAVDKKVDVESFYNWMQYFKKIIDPKEQINIEELEVPTQYLEYCGKGTTDRKKADGRMHEMINHLREYLEYEKQA